MATKSALFNEVQIKEPPRSRFDLSRENKFSCNMGSLVVSSIDECLPGDKWQIRQEIFCRLQPMLAPMMHRVNLTLHYFFIPCRLLWNNPVDKNDSWETFITGGEDGMQEPAYPVYHLKGINAPTTGKLDSYPFNVFGFGSLADFLGLNIQNLIQDEERLTGVDMFFSALPFRAYAQVWNDYYRDQNLQDEIEFSKTGGTFELLPGSPQSLDNISDFTILGLKNRAWTKDYFTSSLPWVQRGDPMAIPFSPYNTDVVLNRAGLSSDPGTYWVDKQGDAVGGSVSNYGSVPLFLQDDGLTKAANGSDLTNLAVASSSSNQSKAYFDPNNSLHVPNLQNVATIQDLRVASAIQRWEEAHALSGGRYTEQIMTDWFTRVPDYRLQRAEYIGGSVQPIVVNEVLQTSETNETPLGTLAGHAVSASNSGNSYYYCQEHGFILGIVSILPEPAYYQGLGKMWTRFDRFDYPFPRLQGLGEQPVYRREVLFHGINNPDNTDYAEFGDDEVFGYQGQNADWKFRFDEIHGDFKSSLSFWHMARKFAYGDKAVLDANFVVMREGQTNDPFAVSLNDKVNHFLCDIWVSHSVSRYLPFWSDPKLR